MNVSVAFARVQIEELAKKIRTFLALDDFGFSCRERMAVELVWILRPIPTKEHDDLLRHFVNEVWKAYGMNLPSVRRSLETAERLARDWLDNPQLFEKFKLWLEDREDK